MSKVFNMVGGGGGPAASIFVKGLSQTDTVTATNGSKTLTGKWTQQPNPECVVPAGYTQLEYIKSDGNQLINTQFYPTSENIKINIDFTYISGDYPFGAINYATPVKRTPFLFYKNGMFCLGIGNGDKDTVIPITSNTRYSCEITAQNGSYSVSINGAASSGSYAGTVQSGIGYGLFALNSSQGAENKASIKLYRFSAYQDDDIKCDCVPCKRNSDGSIGMYDLVSNTFLMNSGSGAFGEGAEITQIIEGHLISPIRKFGTWTVTATDGTSTATKDVLVDVITNYEIEMSLTA